MHVYLQMRMLVSFCKTIVCKDSCKQHIRLNSFGAPSHRALCSPRYGTEAHLVLLSTSLATPKRSVTPALLHS